MQCRAIIKSVGVTMDADTNIQQKVTLVIQGEQALTGIRALMKKVVLVTLEAEQMEFGKGVVQKESKAEKNDKA